MIPVGFSLHPDDEFLELTRGIIEAEAEYFEVAPETLWAAGEDGSLRPNGFFRKFADLRERTQRRFVAHGVGLSMGTRSMRDAVRRAKWFERVRADMRAFDYAWWTDHLGATSLAGLAVTLPLPLPMNAEFAGVVRERLLEMQQIVPDTGVENNVAYFFLGDPLDEPEFLRRILTPPRTHLLLDLFNVTVIAENAGFEPERYLERLDLDRVIEIHLAGAVESDPAWKVRLDGHDAPVPEKVWELLEQIRPRCPNLRGVTLERMEGTVQERDVPLLFEEIRRAKKACR